MSLASTKREKPLSPGEKFELLTHLMGLRRWT
jgi:hypothetical protein